MARDLDSGLSSKIISLASNPLVAWFAAVFMTGVSVGLMTERHGPGLFRSRGPSPGPGPSFYRPPEGFPAGMPGTPSVPSAPAIPGDPPPAVGLPSQSRMNPGETYQHTLESTMQQLDRMPKDSPGQKIFRENLKRTLEGMGPRVRGTPYDTDDVKKAEKKARSYLK